jgi:hypothetical protein
MGYKDDFNPLQDFRARSPDPTQRLIDEMREIQRLASSHRIVEDQLSQFREPLTSALIERQRIIDSIVDPSPTKAILEEFRSIHEAAVQFDRR